SGPAAALQRVGDRTRAGGDLVSAVTIYRRVADMAPLSPEPYLAMGDTLLALGAYNDAVMAYHDAISRGAKVDAYRGLGNALIAQDQPALALTQFDEAIRRAAGDVRGYSGKGVALDMLGDYAAAQQVYRRALEIDPNNKTVLNNLALSLAFSGAHQEAIDLLLPIALDPGATPRHRQNLALAYGLAGDMTEAARIARMDLDEESVQKNLAYYQVLRARKQAIGGAKSVGAYRSEIEPKQAPPGLAAGDLSPLADPALLSFIESMNDAAPGPGPSPPRIE
ncbi:MAG: tetratricopeptide repeat protein, partial [Kiloniellales bacterium]